MDADKDHNLENTSDDNIYKCHFLVYFQLNKGVVDSRPLNYNVTLLVFSEFEGEVGGS
jgi:hypothetical protein